MLSKILAIPPILSFMSGTHWPTAVDYQTALQIPHLSFSRDDLRNATIETTTWGLPLALTGNMAVVFRLIREDKKIAVRCFTRKQALGGMEERYGALRSHLKASGDGLHLPALRDYEFRANGIQIDGNGYPIMIMPWLRGKQLQTFIDRHLDEPDALRALAERWRTFMRTLRRHSFAHGDLSDGNILVDQDLNIQLIDYDAAFVPALASSPPNEVGKPNFQHPDRLNPQSPQYGYYGENVDAFASMVIYVSLRATAADPDLWETFHDEDNLIFTNKDFLQPGETPIWKRLHDQADADIRQLVDLLEQSINTPVDQLPDLETALASMPPSTPVSVPEAPKAPAPVAEAPPAQPQPPVPAEATVSGAPASRSAKRRKNRNGVATQVPHPDDTSAKTPVAVPERAPNRAAVAHQKQEAEAEPEGGKVFGVVISVLGFVALILLVFLLTGASLAPASQPDPCPALQDARPSLHPHDAHVCSAEAAIETPVH